MREFLGELFNYKKYDEAPSGGFSRRVRGNKAAAALAAHRFSVLYFSRWGWSAAFPLRLRRSSRYSE